MTTTCPSCGRDVDEHDRDIRFELPDMVFAIPGLPPSSRLRRPSRDIRMSGSTGDDSVMLSARGIGDFLRALLKVHLTGGYSVTFGVWIEVDPADLRHAAGVWSAPEYADLRLSGRLGNAIGPWGLLGTPVDLAVRDVDETPWCVASTDARMAAVLTRTWDHESVLASLPG